LTENEKRCNGNCAKLVIFYPKERGKLLKIAPKQSEDFKFQIPDFQALPKFHN
jgi:hypothetical protein